MNREERAMRIAELEGFAQLTHSGRCLWRKESDGSRTLLTKAKALTKYSNYNGLMEIVERKADFLINTKHRYIVVLKYPDKVFYYQQDSLVVALQEAIIFYLEPVKK